jgi:uncharacterized phage-associated protein
MATVFDVACYILEKTNEVDEEITVLKLQKLVYYSQAWHLTWESKPLFNSRIEAWANGPVCPELYRKVKSVNDGSLVVSRGVLQGNPSALQGDEKGSIDSVFEFYGRMKPFELSSLTHQEDPWKSARKGLAPGQPGTAEISHEAMVEYYEGLIGGEVQEA